MPHDLSALLPSVVAIAREAGREIMAVYAQDFAVTHKADSSPLTEADLRSHQAIVKGLTALTPDLPILSEESAAIPYAQRAKWNEFWLVDPLDGTREFVARSPEFTVNIALIRGGFPVLGVLHIPVQRVSYYGAQAEAGHTHSAFRQLEGATAAPIRTARPARTPLRVLGSRFHRGRSLDGLLAELPSYELLTVGSALKFCLIAEGSADFYPRLGPTSEWDTAAGQAIVECAGGCVVDRAGRPLRYNAREGLINPDFMVLGDPGQLGLIVK